jgi:hypothetical protein
MKTNPNITDITENAEPYGCVVEVDTVEEIEVCNSVVSVLIVLLASV